MTSSVHRIPLLLALVLGPMGCATPPAASPPQPTALDLTGTQATARVTLHSVIVPGGPDAWAAKAWEWDEYLLTITNSGAEPLTIETSVLSDVLMHDQPCDHDPRKLTDRTLANWHIYQSAHVPVSPATFDPPPQSVVFIPLLLLTYVSPAGLVAVPASFVIAGAIVAEDTKKMKERALAFPLNLPPGASAKGSVFFPMTPGPVRLLLKGKQNGQPVELALPLTPLAHLHLAASPQVTPRATEVKPSP